MLGIAGGEGGIGQLGVQLGRADVAPEGGPMALLKAMDELGIIFREITEPMHLAVAAIFEQLVPILKTMAPFLRILSYGIFPILIAKLTFLTTKLIWTTVMATQRFIKQEWSNMRLVFTMGKLSGSVDANTAAARVAGKASIVGLVVSILAGIWAMTASVKAAGRIDAEMLKMQQDAKLEEQRKQAKDIPRTAGFLDMAKAISADAGLAMAFRPDIVDPGRRDEVMEKLVNYLDAAVAGTLPRTGPTDAIGRLLGLVR